jgi:hypothetical protein
MRGFATSPHNTNYFEDETMTTTPTASPELPGLGYLQFRKKPVVIEAIQWPGCRFLDAPPQWFIDAMHKTPGESGFLMRIGDDIFIETLEGRMRAEPGDWIIRGIKGEIYPCKPEIFEASYERADRAQPEGEAPQAEPVASVTDKYSRGGYNDEIDVLLRVGTKLYAHPPAAILSPLCGAQHAESGASDLDAFGAWKSYPLPDLNSDGHFDKDWLHREFVAFKAGRRAALAAQQAAAPGALEPVDYDLLPPVGSKVLIHLARQDEWVEHTVTGYYVWPAHKHQVKEGEKNAHRVFVRVKDGNGYDNARLLSEIKAVTHRVAQLDGGQEGSE